MNLVVLGSEQRREIDLFAGEAEIKVARTPPSSWYLDASFWDLEKETVLRRHWLVAGRRAQVSRDRDFLSVTIGASPLVILNDAGELRALHNVCRHHAACITQGDGCFGKERELVCPYHGWRYHLDGRLKSAPRSGGIQMHDDDRRLPKVHLTTWGPYVWVFLGDDPPALAEQLAPLKAQLQNSGWEDLTYVGSDTYDIGCNWKVYVDNYLDGGYHIPHAHKSLGAELDLSLYETKCYDRFSVQASPPSGAGHDPRRLEGGALYAWIHPNFMLNRYGPILDTNLVIPLGPDRCRVLYDYFFAETEGQDAQAFIEESLRNTDRIQREDMEICENVQRGLRSPSYNQGWYASDEVSALLFHRLLQQDYRRVA